jgi:hypothetical protein
VFENLALRMIFEHKREERIEAGTLHSEQLHDFYFSQNIIKVIK